MLAISLWQPWATLAALGLKGNETRSWFTGMRGALAIHASLNRSRSIAELCAVDEHINAALAAHGLHYDTLPRGGIIALTQLRDVARIIQPGAAARVLPGPGPELPELNPATLTPAERAFGDYTPGRFAWHLEQARALPALIPCRGQQRIWTLPDLIRDQVYAGLHQAASHQADALCLR